MFNFIHSANNVIGDEGAKAILKVLPQASALEEVDLNGNKVSDNVLFSVYCVL